SDSGTTDEATPNGWSPDRVTIPLLSRQIYNYNFFLLTRLLRHTSLAMLVRLLAKTVEFIYFNDNILK
ncbi:hypothetical protein KAI52_02425, partial [Candidatus Parcubacteria bacterium]|nr:hypothetical protein [Candidatus Parcubacteria bacterium]